MFIAESSIEEINKLKKQLSELLEIKDLGYTKQILIIRIIRDKINCTLKLLQDEYVKKVLHKFNKNKVIRIIRDKINCTLKLLQDEYVKKVLHKFNKNKVSKHFLGYLF
jgi:hypothetical protein